MKFDLCSFFFLPVQSILEIYILSAHLKFQLIIIQYFQYICYILRDVSRLEKMFLFLRWPQDTK